MRQPCTVGMAEVQHGSRPTCSPHTGDQRTMTTETRRRAYRAHQHVTRAARRSLRDAGARKDVARVLGRAPSTIRHEVTDRCHPTIQAALAIVIDLTEAEGVTGRAVAEAFTEIVEIGEILEAETDTLIKRGLWLTDAENTTCRDEQTASMLGDLEHEVALRRHSSVSAELADVSAELRERGVSLKAEYRASKVGAA